MVGLAGGCSREPAPQPVPSATVSAAAAATKPKPKPVSSPAPSPQPLLFLPTSAYHASVAIDDEAVYVLTPTAVHRIVVGQRTESFPRELEGGALMTPQGLVYWSKGTLFEAPKGPGEPRKLAVLSRAPQRLAAARERLAWIDVAAGHFSIQTLEAGQAREVYASRVALDAIAMLGDEVCFVERLSAKGWRIGCVDAGARSEAPRFTPEKRGRSPAGLIAFGDALYFQDASGYKVMELSRDLRHERTLARDLVCSPLAVWEQVYCAQVEGLVEVSGTSGPPRLLAPNGRGLITSIAASPTAVAWISDAGPDQLTVKFLAR